MSDSVNDQLDALARRAAAELRRSLPDAVPPAALLDGVRAVSSVRSTARHGTAARIGLAAALAATFLAGIGIGRWAPRPVHATAPLVVARPVGDRAQFVRFIFVAPRARQVALVGQFNGWNAAATPMHRSPAGGLWTASVSLAPGRHLYAYVVDDSAWVPDPDAPLAPDSWFGVRNSVMVVSDGSGL